MDDSIIAEIRRTLADRSAFLIFGHEYLDGDCLGSQLALYHWLTGQGKRAVVVADGPTMENLEFLPGFDSVRHAMPTDFEAEISLCLDTASAERLLPGVRLQGRVINIDHHRGNTRFGDLNWIEPKAAAVAEQIFVLIDGDNQPPTPEIAACLYVGLLTDTGAFRYSNTSARTFEIATALVRAGADPYRLASGYYDSVHPDTARMTGEVLGGLRFELDGRLVWSEITREMYERLGGLERQPEQLAGQMRSIRGVEVSVLFHEEKAAKGRASFRSRGRVDVSRIAAELGGGGHKSAAGCRFNGDYAAGRERVLKVVRRHVAAVT